MKNTKHEKHEPEHSPLDIWHKNPDLRPMLMRYHIVGQDQQGEVFIPAFTCQIVKDQGKNRNTRPYPFHYQKMYFALQKAEGDWKFVLEDWDEKDDSFACGKDDSISITLLGP